MYTTNLFNPDLPDPGDHRPWYHLNWSSPTALRHNERKLTVEQRWYLQHITERVKEFRESFAQSHSAEDDYRTVASMIAMACSRSGARDRDASADLSFKDRFLRCRRIKYKTPQGNVQRNGKCGQRRFCPFCNYLFRQEALATYVPAFDQGYWYAMTISSTTDLNLDLDELTFSWDAGKAVVRALIQAGHFQGAYWTEELHLESLYPDIRVLPHCHVLFHAKAEADMPVALALAEQTFLAHFKTLERTARAEGQTDTLTLLEPSIELDSLDDETSLYKWCDYLTKTIRVVDAYQRALDTVGDEDRWRVNVEFEQFLAGLVMMLEEDTPQEKKPPRKKKVRRKKVGAKEKPKRFWVPSRKQRHRLGTLRPGRSSSFVGVRPKDRSKHREALKALRQQIIVARAASNQEGAGLGVEE